MLHITCCVKGHELMIAVCTLCKSLASQKMRASCNKASMSQERKVAIMQAMHILYKTFAMQKQITMWMIPHLYKE